MTLTHIHTNQHIQPILYYVYDPMCSWCWGYAPTWHKLKAALEGSGVMVKYQLGGLAADSNEPMPLEMQDFYSKLGAISAINLVRHLTTIFGNCVNQGVRLTLRVVPH